MTLVFGASTRTFSSFSQGNYDPEAFQNEINALVLYFVYLFVGRFVINYIGRSKIRLAVERGSADIRCRYSLRLHRRHPDDEFVEESVP